MASLRGMTQIPETYEDLTWKFLKLLPSGYNRVSRLLPGSFTKVSRKKGTWNFKQSNHSVKQVENSAKF